MKTIAAGIKTSILIIAAPSEAAAGETVEVTVIVKNIDVVNHVVACVALYDSERFIDLAAIIYSGETHAFIGSFTMPNKAVTISVWSYYPYYSEWIADDSATVNIALKTVEPEFAGFGITDYQTV